ncbi:MAG: hypothetical protein LDL30_05100 [Desulfovibrio sp.]|nr:hypothetical protein [Desulfovibrio sp.]MCA1985567.1 hypothetical protein [Desulfovibrio sp.]
MSSHSAMRQLSPAAPRPPLRAACVTACLTVCLAALLLPGCARFQKVDVEREFKDFIALYKEMNTFTEAVFLMEHSKVLNRDLSDFLQQKLFETKLQLETVIDIIFFYKYSDFRNYENYLVVYRYVNQRLDTVLQGFAAQDKFMSAVEEDHGHQPHVARYTREYRQYLARVIAQINELKEKTK